MAAANLTVPTKASPFPYGATALAAYTNTATIHFDNAATDLALTLDGQSASNEDEIIQILAKAGNVASDSAKSASYFALTTNLRTLAAFPEIVAALDSLDDYLAYRTYLVGHEPSAADWAVWGALKGNIKVLGLLKNNQHTHLLRWFSHLESLKPIQKLIADFTAAKAQKARSNKTAAGFALGLQDAVEGQVVTRFPPEPSGYLHIGHAKAAILNQYFARMYRGKLIIRFDDTNPSKERTEFQKTILEDLQLLDIHGDKVTHTSDYFDQLYELAVKMIKDGKAYADDTEKEQMQKERFDGIASKHRDNSVEDNLKRFEEMKSGSEEGQRWCLRAKLSVDSPNKALRDPVIYRCNLTPHHRTGDKWKIYPTYDFACPLVDSIEGVTHALRTNEYRDRNPQYLWMNKTLGMRKVNIWDFSRLNFVYTLLSKRKLHWFVDNGHVSGWDDPRFPTVRGIRRRGMTVEALTQFMLSQGPSSAVVSLEWDSIWALNKKIIDPVAPRHWAIISDKSVPVTVNGGPSSPEIKSLPRHKKNPDVGEKKTVYASHILIEQEDAASFDLNEEITLMDWGNAIVRTKSIDAAGTVTEIVVDLHLEGDVKKTKKKITWLAAPKDNHPLPTVSLVDFDYLITKKKLEENDEFADFVTPVTEFKETALADANVLDLPKGEIIQFERKGYYIYDGEKDGVKEFFKIPDGKAAGIASKAATAAAAGAQKAATPAAPANEIADPSAAVTSMYKVKPINPDENPTVETGMYKVKSLYTA
ncbi:glutamate-tRNA ligase [Coprinopsis cinerea okayama7|uniref:glutamate--tRNA ligase n=1 Tax=Coprinopsis cinerea (strain Okayama-7 / 130 / ATCC MYA-4618 / FGSC 9003) TaxID=240176 RepID=A8NEG0_COPC7|nr:glutamate-tRNA ligase [Coprinopsis cinerea okayama7\|eukprot:XP_001833016.1 glutamate-tRNA ligase [Coprinopsis cinerea okayama7\